MFSDGPHAATESFEIGNPDLGTEVGWGFDGTLRYQPNGLVIEAGVFASVFEDFIYLAPTDEVDPEEELPIFRYLQDDAKLWGGELFIEKHVADFGPWSLFGDASFEYVRGETDTFGDLPRIPPFSMTWGAELARDIFEFRGEVVFTAEQDDNAAFELPTEDFTFVNLKATAEPFGEKARFVFEIRNATDEEGRLHTSQLKDTIPLPGRSFRFGVLSKF